MEPRVLTPSDLLKLKRFNTPAYFNGWEAITKGECTEGLFNREETRDFMEEMGPMIGCVGTEPLPMGLSVM